MPDGFLTAVAAVINALFLGGSVYIYLSLVRQIAARAPLREGEDELRTFGLPDAILASALATLFIVNAATSSLSTGKVVLRSNELIANGLVSLGLFLFVFAFLAFRGRNVSLLAGFSKLGFRRTFITGGVLLFAAYPLIFLADLLTQRLL
ncbi:MAG: hypothetical protein H0X04_11115, partial [Chthoniobacterales bacterium]|nr:hypothetical protein [Chthoniobacterales bacterium]